MVTDKPFKKGNYGKERLSRKDLRKKQRRKKKERTANYFMKKKAFNGYQEKKFKHEPGGFVRVNKEIKHKSILNFKHKKNDLIDDEISLREVHEIDQKIKTLKKEMKQQRIKALCKDNEEEDRTIRHLEKKLNLNKRKSKTIPKSFVDCGLDYILDVCDAENMKAAVNAELNLQDSESEFEEDLAYTTGRKNKIEKFKDKHIRHDENNLVSSSLDDDFGNDDKGNEAEEEYNDFEEEACELQLICDKKKLSNKIKYDKFKSEITKKNIKETSTIKCVKNGEIVEQIKRKKCSDSQHSNNKKVKHLNSDAQVVTTLSNNCGKMELDVKKEEKGREEFWEDIYGRTRDKSGNVVKDLKEKYVPPHLRECPSSTNKKKELEKIRKQIKGLLNRLAENNMHNISNQIGEMYMKNSRYDMNETMLALYLESLISEVNTPERLVMEHAMLIAILQANVGTEIGGYFLQNLVKKFDELHSKELKIENKNLDNLVLLLSHFYTFKIYHCDLLYDILACLCESFEPKDIDLILVILRSVGFSLRKDDPLALKKLILRVQKLANEASDVKDDARVRFMLDVLLGIKNNNMCKIPGYDPSHAEHLKKIIRPMFGKGNYVAELKISIEDLLKADERGRWWIIGSAWTGPAPNNAEKDSNITQPVPAISQEILDLAKTQRMNTINRKNIFCILMTAEDYLDAFEKLLKLGLKGQLEQEIVHVLIHCLLNENLYNPYYGLIAEQLCMSDRRHQMTIQYSIWDRFKEIKRLKKYQITNLAKFLAHLFLQKSLPISVLKVVEFVELDKSGVRLIRQVLLNILLNEEEESTLDVFKRIAKPTKLLMLRQSLALFLHHFILRNKSKSKETTDADKLIQERGVQVLKILNCFTDVS